MTADQIVEEVKKWQPRQIYKLAAQLLIVAQPKFHGSKTIHYADGNGKRIVDNVAVEI